VTPSSSTTVARRGRAGLVLLALLGPLLVAGACSSGDGEEVPSAATAAPSVASSDQAVTTMQLLIDTGLEQIDGRQYDEAGATFQSVLDLDPTNAYGWYNLGYLAELQDDDPTAVQRYATALSHDKDFSPALYNLAILTESSDLGAAVALYRREIAVKPDDSAAYMRLGFALRHLGQEPEAKQMLQKGIELDPSMADVTSPTYQ
jgi:Flp pilus assembly protein TadD